MDTRAQVEDKVIALTVQVLGVDRESVSAQTAFEADLGAKSSNLTMIITQLEDEFDVEIPYLEVKRARTVAGLTDLVTSLCEE